MGSLSAKRAAMLALSWKLLLLLAIPALDTLFGDYDSSATLQLPERADGAECPEDQYCPALPSKDAAAPKRLSSLMVWDSVFMMDIASNGYQYEHFYAFFPLLPALCGMLGSSLAPALGLLMSAAAFTAMVTLFALLSMHELQDASLSAIATLFLIFNPASIFYTAAYTESLYGALCMAGLYLLRCKRSMWGATIAFTLASCCRSNGVINGGFLLHEGLQRAFLLQYAEGTKWRRLPQATLHLMSALLAAMLVSAPVAIFQLHGYLWFCPGIASTWLQPKAVQEAAHLVGSTAPSTAALLSFGAKSRRWLALVLGPPAATATAGGLLRDRPWCHWTIPRIYNFVQERYWGVGPLRYFELKQLPNFLLAAPTLVLATAGCVTYIKANVLHMLTGGLVVQLYKTAQQQDKTVHGQYKTALPHTPSVGYLRPSVAVYIYPWAFMALTATFVMHVQVATRFLSSCPPLYWYMAHICHSANGNSHSGGQSQNNYDSKISYKIRYKNGSDNISSSSSRRDSSNNISNSNNNNNSNNSNNSNNNNQNSKNSKNSNKNISSRSSSNNNKSNSNSSSNSNKASSSSSNNQVSNSKNDSCSGGSSAAALRRNLLLCWAWCWVYTTLGTTLFVNFYPWT